MEALVSWRDGAAKQAILDFVSRAAGDGSDAVPVEERVAVFDNDGTLWCEKPIPIQADFILRRLAEMAEADPERRDRQALESGIRTRQRVAEQGDTIFRRSWPASLLRTRGSASMTSQHGARITPCGY